MKTFRIVLFIFLLSSLGGLAILRSDPVQARLQKKLLTLLATSGLKVESIGGNLPFQIHLKNVEIAGAHFDQVTATISLPYLLKKELHISALTATGFRLEKSPLTESKMTAQTEKLPFTIAIRSFDIQGQFNLTGSAKLKKNGAGRLHVTGSKPEIPEAQAQLKLKWNADLVAEATIEGTTPTLKAFTPWIQIEQEGALEFKAHGTGSPQHYSGELAGKFAPESVQASAWDFHTNFKKDWEKPLHLDQLLISHKESKFAGSVDFDSAYKICKAEGNLRAQLPQGVIYAAIDATQVPTGLQIELHWHSESLRVDESTLTNASGSIQGLYAQKGFTGNAELKATWLDEQWQANSPLTIQLDDFASLTDIQLQSALSKVHGNVTYQIRSKELKGKLQFEQASLSLIHRVKSSLPALDGIASGTVWFDNTGLYADIAAQEVFSDSLYAATVSFYKAPSELKLSLANTRWNRLLISTAQIDLKESKVNVTATGSFNEPFELQAMGTCDQNQCTLNQLQGTFAAERFSANQPSTLGWGRGSFHCTPLLINLGNGSLFFEGAQSRKKTDIALTLTNISLKNFPLNPLDVPLSGKINLGVTFHEENGISTGEIKGSIDKGTLALLGTEESISLDGQIEAKLFNNYLRGKCNIFANQTPFFALDFSIPLTIDPHRLKLHLHQNRQVAGSLSIHGQVAEILDFIDFGTHRIEGNLNCELTLSGKLNRPHLVGSCELSNGRYQNYLTGTDLIDLQGMIKADGEHLILETLIAHDGRTGTFQASGSMDLSVQKDFPFQGSIAFSELEILQLDLISASAVGNIHLKGDLKSAKVTGTTEIASCNIVIPDTIPRSFPDLHIVYKNAPSHMIMQMSAKVQKESAPYPLNLDLKVTSPKGILINGRGITSEWKGDFAIGGLYTNPSVDGKLELVHGEFLFAGKHFKLLDGSIGMQGKTYEMPIIDISANTAEKGISITARIKGPLNTPQITFQSSPPLPLSAIVSYLIFGKDLSEVSGIQALQLASTVATLAGEGPDILEMTRKTLGVDRLQIVMTPQSLDPGADTVALEVGKVIFPGFLVTLRQGAEEDSTNIGIEVDLTHGFTLGLESQQSPEQGKFSLNWNINY